MKRALSTVAGLIVFAACIGGVMPAVAEASIIGYELTVYGDTNVPNIKLTNLSDIASIEFFSITIGRTSRNFDEVYTPSTSVGISYIWITGDLAQSGVRTDIIEVEFTDGFLPGAWFDFETDIDVDSSNSVESFKTVFYNNGSYPNSEVVVRFTGGHELSMSLPDISGSHNSATISQTETVSTVPAPGAVWLLATGLVGMVGVRRRK